MICLGDSRVQYSIAVLYIRLAAFVLTHSILHLIDSLAILSWFNLYYYVRPPWRYCWQFRLVYSGKFHDAIQVVVFVVNTSTRQHD